MNGASEPVLHTCSGIETRGGLSVGEVVMARLYSRMPPSGTWVYLAQPELGVGDRLGLEELDQAAVGFVEVVRKLREAMVERIHRP